MLMTISTIEIGDMMAELEQKGMMLLGIIVVLSIFLSWLLSTILVKPLARVTKAIEDLTDGMQDDAISVPDYTETELITDAFNKMVNRMKILDESRQEFVSNDLRHKRVGRTRVDDQTGRQSGNPVWDDSPHWRLGK